MARIRWALLLTLFALSSACSSSGDPHEEELEGVYENSLDFLWDEALEVIRPRFRVASADPAKREIVTEWDTQLSMFSHQGWRTRLIVTFEESKNPVGWRVMVKEEKEQNTEHTSPDLVTEADWDPVEAEGLEALKFKMAYQRRVNPRQSWRDDVVAPAADVDQSDAMLPNDDG